MKPRLQSDVCVKKYVINTTKKKWGRGVEMKRETVFRKSLVILTLVGSLSLFFLVAPGAHSATELQTGVFSEIQIPQEPDLSEIQNEALAIWWDKPLLNSNDSVHVMVEMDQPPAIEVYARHRSSASKIDGKPDPDAVQAVRAHLAQIEYAQQMLIDELTGGQINAHMVSRTQRAFNGVTVQVAADKLNDIYSLPGVKAVHLTGLYYRMTDTSVPFIGAPSAWDPNLLGGSFTGSGVVIAVIDDGIDYTHTNFGGVDGYEGNDRRVIEPGTFPTAKIINGFDLAGDDFDAASSDPSNRTPRPDPDPLPCNDHGTKVASVIAGLGVNNDGTTYTGPYDLTTHSNPFRIGPGVAPQASLIALKVFGCGGATRSDLIVQAIERALDPNGDGNFSDRADIINMSLGSPFFPFAGSPEFNAIDNAHQAGSIIVVAAGNNGDTYYSVNGLGQHPNALSVAAVIDNGVFAQNVRVNSPFGIAGDYPAAISAFGPALFVSSITGNLVYATPNDGCAPLNNAAQMVGNIALVDRGNCTLVTKARNAQNAGATAVIVANNTSGLPLNVGDDGSGRDIKIPNYLITQTTGDLFRQQLQALNQVKVSLLFDNVTSQPNLANTLLPSSSRGGVFGNAVKPDISAPGANITSSWFGSGNGSASFSGTSMASPHVAGVAALLKEKYPNFTPDELKIPLYNTGTDVFSGANDGLPQHGTSYAGAGTVQAIDAAATEIYVAYKEVNTLTITSTFVFGDVKESTDNETLPVIVNVTNNGSSTQNLAITYDRTSDIPGVDPSFPSTVSVPGNSTAEVQLNWNLIPLNMRHTRDATVGATQGGNPRHWLSEEIGYFNFTPSGGGQKIRLPAYFAAYPASNMSTTQNALKLTNPAGTIPLGLTGQQVHTGNDFPADVISITSPFELHGTDPDDPITPFAFNHLDLQHTGVRSFRTSGSTPDNRLLFGVSTYGDWYSPNQLTVNVFIDTNRDGTDDFQLFNTSFPNAQGGPSDVFVTRLRNLQTGDVTTQFFLNSFSASQFNIAPFNTNVMILPVATSALGLTDANGRFDYQVKTSVGNMMVDESARFTYDATRPGLTFGANTIFFDLNGATIPIGYNTSDFRAANSTGALLFHHHNTSGNRAGILPVNFADQGPSIADLLKNKKHLDVEGESFARGAKVLINGKEVKKTVFFSATDLRAKKAGKTIQDGDVVMVRNPDGSLSLPFIFRNGG